MSFAAAEREAYFRSDFLKSTDAAWTRRLATIGASVIALEILSNVVDGTANADHGKQLKSNCFLVSRLRQISSYEFTHSDGHRCRERRDAHRGVDLDRR